MIDNDVPRFVSDDATIERALADSEVPALLMCVAAFTYDEDVDDANAMRAWGWSSVSAWYKNRFGRAAQNWPSSALEFWQRTRHAEVGDFEWR